MVSQADFDKWYEEYLGRQNEEQRRQRERYRNEVLPTLNGLRVAVVLASYEGSGDSGSIHSIVFKDAEGKTLEVERSLADRVCDVLDTFIPSGYENNEGGFGNVILNVGTGRVTLEHSQRVEHTEDTTEEFAL